MNFAKTVPNHRRGDPEIGRKLRARAQGSRSDELGEALGALDPDLLDYADGFIFGSVWNNADLEFEDRMLVAITALASIGNTQQLTTYLHGAFQDGIAPERLREALKMLVIYVGFPTAIGALAAFDKVAARYAS